MDNFNLIELLADVFAKHGPAAAAVEKTYSPGDFSVHFFLQLALILLACRIVGWAGRKFLAQPQVVGEMIAGVLLDPSLFGLLAPELQATIFPKEMKNAEIDERELDRLEAIIRSMTPTERVNPVIIDGSRRRRIADGSGTSPNEVTQLVKQFREMQKMMKKMGGMGAMGGRKAKKGRKGKGGGRTSPPALPGKPKVPLQLPGLN
mgnify:CR=1 FL=1